MRRVLLIGLRILFILVFPFIVLIRGSVWVHDYFNAAPMVALIGGMCFAAVVLVLYFSYFYGKFTGRIKGIPSLKKRFVIALFIVMGYGLHGILFLSSKNVKHREIRKEYLSLHPVLRVGVSTLIMLDRDLVITDAGRTPEDYDRMGLKSNKNSLHYRQKDGFTYAIDLRTNGRSGFRNFLTATYFKLMGFNVLRHMGTGDHLHISLSHKDKPGVI